MKKIMFNDKYGLTQAVLGGRKTQTRRVAVNGKWSDIRGAAYRIGEEVAVAQSYKDCLSSSWIKYIHDVDPAVSYDRELSLSPGQDNKMFVRAELMPHRIKITNIRVERLQDISDEDCLKEGIGRRGDTPLEFFVYRENDILFDTPQRAFASLIDKTCGKGTWDSNPWVFVYDFEIIQ